MSLTKEQLARRKESIGASDAKKRFMSCVQKCANTGCWIWVGGVGPGKYGAFQHNKKRTTAHRFSHILFKGPVTHGLVVDHLCRNTRCVNPDHLEEVTHAENVRRGNGGLHQRSKTHCPRGHEYDAENTGRQKSGRYCRKCDRAKHRRYEDQNREQINARRRAAYHQERSR